MPPSGASTTKHLITSRHPFSPHGLRLTHHYGHFKAEYFFGGLDSVRIVAAELAIMHAAIGRLQEPQPLEQLGLGLAISLAAPALNGWVAWVLLKASRGFDSITLRADAHHLLTITPP